MRPEADPWRRGKSGIEVRARVVPRSSTDEVEGIDETPQGSALRVRVRAVPDRGKANRSVEKTVADWLGVPRTSVAIIAGAASRVKLVAIAGKPDVVDAAMRDRVTELKPRSCAGSSPDAFRRRAAALRTLR